MCCRRLITSLAVLMLSACQSTPPTAPVAEASADDATTAVAAIEEAKPIATYKQQQSEADFAEAIRGLSFEQGFVRVESPPAAPDPVLARRLIAEGDAAIAGNQRTSAIALYGRAVQAAPGRVAPYLRLARAFVMKGRIEHAIDTYRTAVELDPANLEGHVGLANALARAGRRTEAIEAMQGALAIDPGNGRAHERLAVWHYYEGDLDAARAHLRAAQAAGHPMPPQFIELLSR